MDPEVALQKLRDAIHDFKDWKDREKEKLPIPMDDVIEHFEALDSWLQRGGFLPKDWSKNR